MELFVSAVLSFCTSLYPGHPTIKYECTKDYLQCATGKDGKYDRTFIEPCYERSRKIASEVNKGKK